MAGAKGRSGGARPNSGPKPKKAQIRSNGDSLEFLESVQNDDSVPLAQRIQAAAVRCQYLYPKPWSKPKEAKPSGGRFKAAAPPLKLVVGK